jgi:hypothetical protein
VNTESTTTPDKGRGKKTKKKKSAAEIVAAATYPSYAWMNGRTMAAALVRVETDCAVYYRDKNKTLAFAVLEGDKIMFSTPGEDEVASADFEGSVCTYDEWREDNFQMGK